MNRNLKSVMITMAKIGAAWWLLKKLPAQNTAKMFEARTPEDFGLRSQPPESSIDETIAASFPASDPSPWTPIAGTGSTRH